MGNQINARQQVPRMLDVMREDFLKVSAWLLDISTRFVTELFATHGRAAQLRRWLTILVFGFSWAWFAAAAHPIQISDNLIRDLIAYPFTALFAADIFRHVIVLALVFWLSLRLAATYMDDVFELNDLSIAERYILQAVFGSSYNIIHIKDGKVALDQRNSPLARIGGPGLVKVHLENAALFEKLDGKPVDLGPTAKPAVIDRFERLRAVVDLRDQIIDVNVRARTKDGIHIELQGARLVYSIARGNKEPTLEVPHPFERQAVQKVVYGQQIFKSLPRQGEEEDGTNPAQLKSPILDMRAYIEREIKEFISKSTLNEFLARITDPETEKRAEQEEILKAETVELTADTGSGAGSEGQKAEVSEKSIQQPADGKFETRDMLTKRFYTRINEIAERERGLQMHWIDIGTWVLPDEAKKVPEQHLDAWRLSVENLAKGNEKAFDAVRNASRTSELLRLYRELPHKPFVELRINETEEEKIIRELVLAYREKIRNAWKIYEDSSEPPPEELDMVVRYLSWISAHHLG